MPTWSEVLTQIRIENANGNPNPFDFLRRKFLKELSDHTGRNTILYATAFTQKSGPPELLSVTEEDVQGMMEVCYKLDKKPTDLILHSPGGSPEAAGGIVDYINAQFPSIRVIIPQIAMSAATMMACSGTSIIMGKHSNLGPVDPQLILNSPSGPSINPAKAIIDQFYKGLEEINYPNKQAWSLLLSQYGPSLITQCENYIDMSKSLVKEWLQKYMFNGEDSAPVNETVQVISDYLSDHDNFKSHSRHISREKAKEIGLKIDDLEADPILQDKVLSAFHSTTHTFTNTQSFKIIENQNGKAFIKVFNGVS